FASETGELDAAKRRLSGRNETGVHAHHSVFERLRYAEDARQIFSVEIGGKAEFGVVSLRNHIGFILELKKRRDRAERLFSSDRHQRRYVGEHSRFIERAG